MFDPTDGKYPLDYGWIIDDNCVKPEWLFGISIPKNLTGTISEGDENKEVVLNDEKNDVWSGGNESKATRAKLIET